MLSKIQGSAALLSGLCVILLISGLYNEEYSYLLTLALLFSPLLDKEYFFSPQAAARASSRLIFFLVLAALVIVVYWLGDIEHLVLTALFVALPEEWYFRRYLLMRLGGDFRANLVSSLLFSLAHALSRDPLTGVLVFIPSLIYGAVYQKYKNLLLCVVLHAASNIFYAQFLKNLWH